MVQTRPGKGRPKAAQEKVTVRPGKGTNPPRKWLQSAQDMCKSRPGKGANPPRKCKSCRKVQNGVPYNGLASGQYVGGSWISELALIATRQPSRREP